MAGRCLLGILFFSFCYCQWVLLPSLSAKQRTSIQDGNKTASIGIIKSTTRIISPYFDIHNLTLVRYGTVKNKKKFLSDWIISLDDISQFINIIAKIPGTSIGKINFLAHLQKNLIMSTENQLTRIYNPEPRRARFSHLSYPSMESSLMTISLLLFGVYLTKIIVKILQNQYSKHNLPMGTLHGIRAPIMVAQGRKKRSTDTLLQELHLIYLINKYNYKYKINHFKNFKLK